MAVAVEHTPAKSHGVMYISQLGDGSWWGNLKRFEFLAHHFSTWADCPWQWWVKL